MLQLFLRSWIPGLISRLPNMLNVSIFVLTLCGTRVTQPIWLRLIVGRKLSTVLLVCVGSSKSSEIHVCKVNERADLPGRREGFIMAPCFTSNEDRFRDRFTICACHFRDCTLSIAVIIHSIFFTPQNAALCSDFTRGRFLHV